MALKLDQRSVKLAIADLATAGEEVSERHGLVERKERGRGAVLDEWFQARAFSHFYKLSVKQLSVVSAKRVISYAASAAVVGSPSSRKVFAAPKPQPGRAGKKVVTVYLPESVWRDVKVLAAKTDNTIDALMREGLDLIFEKHGINRGAAG